MKLLYRVLRKVTPAIPMGVRNYLRKRVSLFDYDMERRKLSNPYRNDDGKNFSNSPVTVGVIEDVAQYHQYYIAACRDLGISYVVLNILKNNWIEEFIKSDCMVFVVWPTNVSTVYKELFDYRLYILQEELGKLIYPTWKECWLTEHKPRLHDWLSANHLPHPRTWVFYDKREAFDFVETAPLPIVSKTATGASASGIKVIQNKKELVNKIKEAFGKGQVPRGFDPRDVQRNFVYFQEYLPDVEEWRMVRIGDSFFGYRKEKGPSGLHSASHTWSWLDPGIELLNLLKHVTDVGGFTSMDVDIFRTKDGKLYVNECQTVFGCTTPAVQMKINDVEGRYLYQNDTWVFEPGTFSANHMCNLRMEYLVGKLKNN